MPMWHSQAGTRHAGMSSIFCIENKQQWPFISLCCYYGVDAVLLKVLCAIFLCLDIRRHQDMRFIQKLVSWVSRQGRMRVAHRFIAGKGSNPTRWVPEGRLTRQSRSTVPPGHCQRTGSSSSPTDELVGYSHRPLRGCPASSGFQCQFRQIMAFFSFGNFFWCRLPIR